MAESGLQVTYKVQRYDPERDRKPFFQEFPVRPKRGMTVLEAMYFGVPVIASAEAGPKEIISNGIDGILLEGFELDTWKNAVINLLDNEKIRVEMGRRASDKIGGKFVWGQIAPKFKEAYELLCLK